MRALCLLVVATLLVATGARVSEAAERPHGSGTEQASPSGTAVPDRDGDGLGDAWEDRWHVGDPSAADTDGNGVPDGAEDFDGDGLSNLGEQLVGTNPKRSDSDGDGVNDAYDDANRNGVRDGLEQDRRPVPADITPALSAASQDTPQGVRDGCHTGPGSAAIHPCAYGDLGAGFTVVLFGDSHALQWEPGLIRAAKRTHQRLVVLTKSGCPSVDIRFHTRPNDVAPCRLWRERAIAWLHSHPPDLVIVTNDRAYGVVDKDGRDVPRDPAWAKGLRRTLSRLPGRSSTLVIADTVRLESDPVPCLSQHDRNMAKCEIARDRGSDPAHDAVERSAARAENAAFVSLNSLVCPYDPCPVVMGHLMMWRDYHHLTATFSRSLWLGIETAITKVETAITNVVPGPAAPLNQSVRSTVSV